MDEPPARAATAGPDPVATVSAFVAPVAAAAPAPAVAAAAAEQPLLHQPVPQLSAEAAAALIAADNAASAAAHESQQHPAAFPPAPDALEVAAIAAAHAQDPLPVTAAQRAREAAAGLPLPLPPPHRVLVKQALIGRVAGFVCRHLKDVAVVSQVGSRWRNAVLGTCPRICERLFDSRPPVDLSLIGPPAYLSPQNLQAAASSAAAAAATATATATAAAAASSPSPAPAVTTMDGAGAAADTAGKDRSVPLAVNEALQQEQLAPSESLAGATAAATTITRIEKMNKALESKEAAAAERHRSSNNNNRSGSTSNPHPHHDRAAAATADAPLAAAVRHSVDAKKVERDYKRVFAQARAILSVGTSALRREVIRAFAVEYERILALGAAGCTAALNSGDPVVRAKRTVFEFGTLVFAFRNTRWPESWALEPRLPILAWQRVHLQFDGEDAAADPAFALRQLQKQLAAQVDAALVQRQLHEAQQREIIEGSEQQHETAAAAASPSPARPQDASSPTFSSSSSAGGASPAAPPQGATTPRGGGGDSSNRRVRPHIASLDLCHGDHGNVPDWHFLPPAISAIQRCRCHAHCRYTASQAMRHPDARDTSTLKRLGADQILFDDSKVLAALCSLPRLHKISLEACRITANVNVLLTSLSRKHLTSAGSCPITVLEMRRNKLYGCLDLSLLVLDSFETIELSENDICGPLRLELLPVVAPNIVNFHCELNPGLERGNTTIKVPLGCKKLKAITLPQGVRIVQPEEAAAAVAASFAGAAAAASKSGHGTSATSVRAASTPGSASAAAAAGARPSATPSAANASASPTQQAVANANLAAASPPPPAAAAAAAYTKN